MRRIPTRLMWSVCRPIILSLILLLSFSVVVGRAVGKTSASGEVVVKGAWIESIDAYGEQLVWTEPDEKEDPPLPGEKGKRRLFAKIPGSSKSLEIDTSSQTIYPDLGPAASGGVTVVYTACRKGICDPYSYNLSTGTRRKLHIRRSKLCGIDGLSIWKQNLVYILSGGRCTKARGRGIYVRVPDRSPIRLSSSNALDGSGTDIRNQRVAWTENDGFASRLVISYVHSRKSFRIYTDRSGLYDASISVDSPELSKRSVYWGSYSESEGHEPGIWLMRARASRRHRCTMTRSLDASDSSLVVTGSRLYYIVREGILKRKLSEMKFRHSSCRVG